MNTFFMKKQFFLWVLIYCWMCTCWPGPHSYHSPVPPIHHICWLVFATQERRFGRPSEQHMVQTHIHVGRSSGQCGLDTCPDKNGSDVQPAHGVWTLFK
jgi:hypothetical protein